jgi:phosphatidate phosphatase APP1
MPGWQRIVARFAHDVETQFDDLKGRLVNVLGADGPVTILPYLGYGTRDELRVNGRVLAEPGIRDVTDNDRLWDNLLNTFRRFDSDEVPFARVGAHFQDMHLEALADDEGFFRIRFEPEIPVATGELWHQVELELLEPLRDDHAPVRATAQALVPPVSAQFGVISDIDDTVVHAHATELLRMARLVFLGNARTRVPFPGVATFYQALQGGSGGADQNPLFYLSSSPWNLYDLLMEFLKLHDIPVGPIFLRDWGISADELLPTRHHTYKLGVLRTLLNFYPHLPFLLIGDSGQEDPEIYSQLVDEYPGRIQAIYIRDVTPDYRDEQVMELAAKLASTETDLILAPDTLMMAEHAAASGWIHRDMVANVADAVRLDRDAPSPAEILLDEAS